MMTRALWPAHKIIIMLQRLSSLSRDAMAIRTRRLAIDVYGVPTGYIVIGGGAQCTDTATGLLLTVPLGAPVGCTALSPLTTLAATLLEVCKPDGSYAGWVRARSPTGKGSDGRLGEW